MANGSLIKSFGGVTTPSYLYIKKVSFQIMPDSEAVTLDVPDRVGQWYIKRKDGIRTFTAEFGIKATSSTSVMTLCDDLGTWLYSKEPIPLIFRDKPTQTYYAMAIGSYDVDKFGASATGTIDFVCYDPDSQGAERTIGLAPTTTDPTQIINGGNKEAYPKFHFEFTKNLTDFAIATDNEMLYFGEPFDVTSQTAIETKPVLINDTGASTTGWTAGVSVDGGQVAGTLSSNGYSFGQSGSPKDYGTGSGIWHGGSLIKSVTKEVQDFNFEAQVGFLANAKNQVGRVEVYLLDINGNKLGKVALRDTTRNMDAVNFEAWVGKVNGGGTSVINSYGTNYPWKQFNGVLRINRVGKKWSFYIAQVNTTTKKHTSRMYKEYTDWKNQYGAKVASIQIHIAAYGTDAPVDQMWISNIYFKEIVSKTSSQVGYVFRNGDILDIDCETGDIKKNGEDYFEDLYPSSKFPVFEPGSNGVSVTDTGFKNATIKFNERWR
jgi:predicted phage tail component-like protein